MSLIRSMLKRPLRLLSVLESTAAGNHAGRSAVSCSHNYSSRNVSSIIISSSSGKSNCINFSSSNSSSSISSSSIAARLNLNIRSLSSDAKPSKKETKKEKNEEAAAAASSKAAAKKDKSGKMAADQIEAQVNNMEETEWMQMFLDKAHEVGSKKIPVTDEVKKRNFEVGREYNKQTSIRDNLYNRDITDKIWLQQDAIRALPEKLRAAAEIIDETPPPEEHLPAFWLTPPKEDFDYSGLVDSQEIAYDESTLSKNLTY